MEYNDVRQSLRASLELAGLDEACAGTLLWRGEEQTLEHGEVIYAEGESLDGTFCLLLSGELLVEKGGAIVGQMTDPQIFGEMAYFNRPQRRAATVTVGSMQAVILKIRLTIADLASARFASLRNHLSRQTWDRMLAA